MKQISPERKASVLAKLLPPYNMPVASVAQMEGISESTLYNWRQQAKSKGIPVPGTNITTEQWPVEARFAVIVETATMSETEIAEYCRKKGLYPSQLVEWKSDFLDIPQKVSKNELKKVKNENAKLKRELIRKEKALAEAAAILVLRKKLNDYYGEADEDN